jgi:hypothetical protein
MYGAPLPDLDVLLSEGGGQGLLVVGALQDLSQAEARWGVVGKGFLTLWQNIVVLPGIRHRETLELLSLLVGDHDRIVPTQGQSQTLGPLPFGFQRRIWMLSEGESIQRERILPPDAIYRGNPAKKREVLVFTPNGGWQHVDLMRYCFYTPWPVVLIQSSDWAVNYGKPQSWALPLPELDRGGDLSYLFDAGGQKLVDSWLELKASWRERQAAIPPRDEADGGSGPRRALPA